MAKYEDLDRCFVATLMPYKPGTLDIDEEGLRKQFRYFMNPKFLGIKGAIIVNPEAGEFHHTSREEKRRAIEIAMEECHDQVPVVAGICAPTVEEQKLQAKDAKEMGVDGLFLLPPSGGADIMLAWNAVKYPYYFTDNMKEILSVADLPVVVHATSPVSSPWGIGIPASAVVDICMAVPQIFGWKMVYAYEGWRIVAKTLRNLPRHVGVFPAGGNLMHAALANDEFDGTVSGCFTYAMEAMADHISAWKNGDPLKACEIWKNGLDDLQAYIFNDFSRMHVKFKTAAWVRGNMPEPFMRPPMPKPCQEEARTLRTLLSNCGLSVIDEKDMNKVMARMPASA